MKRIPAFTIMELMVVSILSVITVAASFNAISLIQNQFQSYSEDTTRALRLSDLNVLLQEDVFYSDSISVEGMQLTFYYLNHNINYLVESDFIVRAIESQNIHNDTFFIPVNYMKLYFEGQEKKEGLISELNIGITYNDIPFSLVSKKQLDAKTLIFNNH